LTVAIDYYFAPQSPWTYLGHARFADIAARHGAQVRIRPVDLGQVFPVSGGLPLGKRAPQRQAYRLVEMARFASHLGLPIHTQPRFFPVAGDPAARLIYAADVHDGTAAAMTLAGAIFAAVWAQQRDIASEEVLAQLLGECGLPAQRLAQSQAGDIDARYQRHTREAIDAGVFGAPSYVVNGEIFWGQDRLDFLERALQALQAQAN